MIIIQLDTDAYDYVLLNEKQKVSRSEIDQYCKSKGYILQKINLWNDATGLYQFIRLLCKLETINGKKQHTGKGKKNKDCLVM